MREDCGSNYGKGMSGVIFLSDKQREIISLENRISELTKEISDENFEKYKYFEGKCLKWGESVVEKIVKVTIAKNGYLHFRGIRVRVQDDLLTGKYELTTNYEGMFDLANFDLYEISEKEFYAAFEKAVKRIKEEVYGKEI
jgi:hypothetical protein